MSLSTTLSANRHKTAISRIDYSRPIRTALADGLIGPDANGVRLRMRTRRRRAAPEAARSPIMGMGPHAPTRWRAHARASGQPRLRRERHRGRGKEGEVSRAGMGTRRESAHRFGATRLADARLHPRRAVRRRIRDLDRHVSEALRAPRTQGLDRGAARRARNRRRPRRVLRVPRRRRPSRLSRQPIHQANEGVAVLGRIKHRRPQGAARTAHRVLSRPRPGARR